MTSTPEKREGGDVLARPRLHEALTAGLGKQMTLVIAPAGYGKSVLLESWAATVDLPVVWVALTEAHNDPGVLARSVIEAVGAALDEPVEDFADRLAFVTPSSAPQLIEEWAEGLPASRDFVLVIDDLHLLLDRSATETAQRLVESSPPNVRLFLASRHDPPLAVARLRLAGRLVEVRQADLAFTLDELRTLLAMHAIILGDDSLNALHVRTEGWPATVRLALISMLQSGDFESVVRDLAGTDRIIAEYLVEEVLADMDPDRQQFLLRTSILDEVSPEIAQILTGQIDGRLILDELVATGDFTRRGSAGTFLYHRLLRDMLRARLRDVDAELYVDLHRQAARWRWQRGDSVSAISHAIAGREIDQATVWLGEAVVTLTSKGQAATLVHLSGRLLDHTVEPGLLLLMTRMWALYDSGSDPAQIEHLMDVLESMMLEAQADGTEQTFVHGGDPRAFRDASALPWLRGLRARANGDLTGLLALDEPGDLPSPSGRVEAFVAEGLLWSEGFDDVETLLETFREHAHHDQFVPSMVHELGMRACSLIGRGRFSEAEELIAEASVWINRFGLNHLIHTLYVQIAPGRLHWERGDLHASEASLVAAQEFADRSGDIPFAVQHALARSRTRWSLGDVDGAHDILDHAGMATGRILTGHFADRINLLRATYHMLASEPRRAERAIPNWRERLASPRELPHARIVLSRISTATGETAMLADVAPAYSGTTNPLHRIEASKLAAARALVNGDEDEAVAALTTAMREATSVGATQRVWDEECLFTPIFFGAARAAGFASPGSRGISGSAQAITKPAWFVEELTDRELEVLERFPTQLTYPEIADLLYISTNTVKSHAKAIFRKLAVTRRTDAVDRARRFGLMPE
jgi:LuxR family maltose regulon positive regulatory protein